MERGQASGRICSNTVYLSILKQKWVFVMLCYATFIYLLHAMDGK